VNKSKTLYPSKSQPKTGLDKFLTRNNNNRNMHWLDNIWSYLRLSDACTIAHALNAGVKLNYHMCIISRSHVCSLLSSLYRARM